MQTHTAIPQASPGRAKQALRDQPKFDRAKVGSKEARDEIHTYAAIRDLLLSDAENVTSAESLRRVTIANESVETCLQTPRLPYEAQYLTEVEAARERQRCSEARRRIAQLGEKLSLA